MRENAILSAQPTHAHPEGIAGAIAAATATAIAYRVGEGEFMSGEQFLQYVVENIPESETCSGIWQAIYIPSDRSQLFSSNICIVQKKF